MVRTSALACLATCALAAPAAAATWSEPRVVSLGADLASRPELVLGADGRGLVTVDRGRFDRPETVTITRSPSGALGAPRTVTRLFQPPQLIGGDRVAALGQTFVRRPRFGPLVYGFGVALGDLGGRAARARTLAAPVARDVAGAPSVALATNARGQMAVAWIDWRHFLKRRVTVVSGRDRFVVRGRGRVNRVAAALGPRRELLVAWQEGGTDSTEGRVRARLRRPGGSFGPVLELGFGYNESPLKAAFAPDGRGYLAWQSTISFSEGGGERGGAVRVATLAPGARRFAAAQELEPNQGLGYYTDGWFALDVGRAGAVLAFPRRLRPEPGQIPEITAAPLAAVAGRDGRFGAATLLAPGRRVPTFDAAIAADGTAAVLLGDGSVAVRPRGGAFRPPEPLGTGRLAFGGDLDLDPRSGRFVAVAGVGEPPARAVAVSERTP